MPENNNYRNSTIPMDTSSKEMLFEQNHPIVREMKSIDGILFEDHPILHKPECISLKELFLKKNMDLYQVDCLLLKKIALKMLEFQMQFRKKGIFPGLYSLEDLYVDLSDSSTPLYFTHPEKMQLLNHEQDYEWYPEDERILGDIILFDQTSQLKADQRFLYRILVAATKGNVKVPPRNVDQDYSSLFYGTLPSTWREAFEQNLTMSHLEWKEALEESIAIEESFEQKINNQTNDSVDKTMADSPSISESPEKKMNVIFILLRSQKDHSLDLSRMVYQAQDRMDMEASHGKLILHQGFIYGDGVIKQKSLRQYPKGYRVQVPHRIQDYSKGEALLVGMDWMDDIMEEDKDALHRIVVISDGRISNDMMFREVIKKACKLQQAGCQIQLDLGRDCGCEGWDQWHNKLE